MTLGVLGTQTYMLVHYGSSLAFSRSILGYFFANLVAMCMQSNGHISTWLVAATGLSVSKNAPRRPLLGLVVLGFVQNYCNL